MVEFTSVLVFSTEINNSSLQVVLEMHEGGGKTKTCPPRRLDSPHSSFTLSPPRTQTQIPPLINTTVDLIRLIEISAIWSGIRAT